MDIKINADGTFDLSTGDASLLKEDGYIGQTIYSYLMELPTDQFAQRVGTTSNETIQSYIRSYLERCLANDSVIDPNLITVTVTKNGTSAISIDVSYDGRALTNTDGYTTPKYSLIAGAAPIVDRSPVWLNYTNFDATLTVPITMSITTTVQSNTIELPVLPICEQGNMQYNTPFACSTISVIKKDLVGVGTYRKDTFNIPVISTQKVYPVSKYLTSTLRIGAEVVSLAVINSAGNTDTASVVTKDGEVCLITTGEGVVNITATVVPAGYLSNLIKIIPDPAKDKCIYPLKPIRGKLYVVLPRTIKPATYIVSYTSYKQRSIW